MHPCFWPIRGTPLCASRLLQGESALGIRAAAIGGPLGGPVEGWWLTLFSPVEDSPSSRGCVTDNPTLRGTHPLSHDALRSCGSDPGATECRQLVSPGFGWGHRVAGSWDHPEAPGGRWLRSWALLGLPRGLNSSRCGRWVPEGVSPEQRCRGVRRERPPSPFVFLTREVIDKYNCVA